MALSSESKLKIASAAKNLRTMNDGVSPMDNDPPDARLSFHVYFIRLHGPENDLTVRVLFVETAGAQTIYEGFGSWSQCEFWIGQLTEWIIPRDVLAGLRKRLEQKRLATINKVRVSVHDIESIGFQRSGQP
jgi:hypothetical protein